MKHLYLFVAVVFSTPLFSSAQNYKPDYVVTLKGDTVRGFINYTSWDNNNPKTIVFKTDLHSQAKQEYSTNDIVAFGLKDSRQYIKAITWISKDKIDNPDYLTGLDTTKVLDTVFLNVVITGKNISLYEYTDYIKHRFYVSEQGKPPVELVFHEYYNPVYQNQIEVVPTYKIQLQKLRLIYQPEDSKLSDQIQDAAYQKVYLKSIIRKLNNNTKSKSNY